IQVLLNLIKNAIQSINHVDRAGKIQLKAEMDEDNKVIINIIDNGSGISPDILDQIFIPFFTTKKEGTGIGLSLSKHIMRLHGGSLFVSCNGFSTTFSLKL